MHPHTIMKQSKANITANREYKRLLKQAEEHISSFRNAGLAVTNLNVDGVNVSSNLRRDINTANTFEVKAYNRFLKKLISTSYERGYEGAAIPSSLVEEYRAVESEWNKAHNRYWSQFADKPLISAIGAESVSVAEQQSMTKQHGNVFGAIGYERKLNIEKVKGVTDLKRRIDRLKYEMSEDYIIEREYTFSKNILRNLHYYGSDELIQAFESLTVEQRSRLQNETLFTEEFFAHIPSDQELSDSEISERIETMLSIIKYIRET